MRTSRTLYNAGLVLVVLLQIVQREEVRAEALPNNGKLHEIVLIYIRSTLLHLQHELELLICRYIFLTLFHLKIYVNWSDLSDLTLLEGNVIYMYIHVGLYTPQ